MVYIIVHEESPNPKKEQSLNGKIPIRMTNGENMPANNKPISASNPPASRGTRTVQEVEQPLVVSDAKKKLTPKGVVETLTETEEKTKKVKPGKLP